MAAKSIEEFVLQMLYFKTRLLPGETILIRDGGGSTNVLVNIACFELIKPSFDETNRHCSLGKDFCVRYVLLQGQDVYSISVLPEEGNTSPKCTPQLTFLSLLEVPFPSKNQMCLDAKLSCRNCINLKVDSEDA
ncbi:hypothetical protein J1N35_038352 [Gossypium stocksii]|uniref:Uncharacterized protein n=1 Tax=Gossypium stocksii TaxID=47602 RepID=A0A9D3ZMK7_9ROSI|nr:hypothetical protein J1N35_038352 [Gossypium stocksii]